MGNFKVNTAAWTFLDEFRGKNFEGKWPTIPQMFDITCERYPNNPCFIAFTPVELRFTYAEARAKVMEVKNFLLSDGVKKGDHIGLSGKNSPEWAIAYLGILYAGATVVPLDITYHDEDMSTLFAFGDVDRVFIDKDRIEKIGTNGKLNLKAKYSLEPGAENYKYVLDLKAEEMTADLPTVKENAAILFTSGTTGTPKGVMLSHENIVADVFLAQGNMPILPTDVFYAILPLHHSYSMVAVFFETISVGASCVFGKKLVVSLVLKEMRLGKVTMFLGVPLLFNKLLSGLMAGVRKKGIVVYGLIRFLMSISGFLKKAFGINVGKKWFGFLLKNLSLDTNRICISGGGPLPNSTFKKFNQLGIDFVQGYGLTETSPITHLNPTTAYIEASAGKSCPEVQVKIVDPDEDGNGIIYLKGPQIMQGYYKNPEATEAVLSEDGWLNTGDVGYQDAANYLYITGRAKNLIVTEGGKNVFPEEIEDHFQLYFDIEQICISGYTIDKKNKKEGIAAIVKPTSDCIKDKGENLEEYIDSIIKDVNRELQSYKKIQKLIISKDPLPMTSTKKIKRFEIQRVFKAELNH